MKRFLLILALVLSGCSQPKTVLHVFIWSEYFDPQIFTDFERDFNCKVTVDFFEDVDSMVAKLAAGGSSLYDIVVPSDTTLPVLIKRGLIAPLRRDNLPNLKLLDPNFTHLPFDPTGQFSVPWDWGMTGLFVRAPKGNPPEATWGLIFDPARQPGPFLLMEDARMTIGAALRYKGFSMNSTDPKEIALARDLLIETKKRSLGFEGGTGCKNSVLSKRASMAMAYNGDSNRGMSEDPETTFVVPKEGTEIWFDLLSIPAQAPHRDLAEKFINYLLEPKVSAKFANWAQVATPNLAAHEFLRPGDLANPTIYPPPEVVGRLEYARDLGDHNRLYDEAWTEIKSK